MHRRTEVKYLTNEYHHLLCGNFGDLLQFGIKLSVGRTGAIRFKVRPIGSNEWRDVQHTTDSDIYQGDTNPVVQNRVFTLPIHQRNTNFELKVTSDLPYPVSLVSMTWEGNYSDKYYRRS